MKRGAVGTRTLLTALLAIALAPAASGQIIATALPRQQEGEGERDRKWIFHVMAAPLAKWRYNEVFLDVQPSAYGVFGEIVGTPSSKFMVAGEASFEPRDGLVLSLGGWLNGVGAHTFDVTGALVLPPGSPGFPDGYMDVHYATFRTDLTMVEYHFAMSYKGFGVQAGVVSTGGKMTSGEFVNSDGSRRNPPTEYITPELPNVDTTDYDFFAVYRRGFGRRGRTSLAVGGGLYVKQAIGGSDVSPLRTDDTKIVPTAFAAASLTLYKGVGIDASYWYVGASDAPDDVGRFAGLTLASDQQSRLTIGVGLTF